MSSPVYTSSFSEALCDVKDRRVKVDPMAFPHCWICSLYITTVNGKQYKGSGFKIHIPNINSCVVVTSGHCVYCDGAYAKKIAVTSPGHAPIKAKKEDLFASPEYIKDSNSDYDYGLISLSGDSNEGFGWSAIVPDKELSRLIVTNCGYPGDKDPWPQMWKMEGKLTEVTMNTLYFMNDTTGGQSGSPVYTQYNGFWTVLGVHSRSGCPNSAPRFTSQIIYRFLEYTVNLRKYALRSAHFTNVYLRCDGYNVNTYKDEGSGIINCQYKPPDSWETFFIYPVEVIK